jgi:hypothetical protein
MAIVQRKLSDLPKSSVVPEGTYRLRVAKSGLFTVEDAKAKKADSKLQDDLIELDLVIVDEGPLMGRHIFDSLPLSGDFAWRLRKFLEAIDYPADEDIDTDRFVDAEVIGVVGIQKESADGKYPEKNRVNKFISVFSEQQA